MRLRPRRRVRLNVDKLLPTDDVEYLVFFVAAEPADEAPAHDECTEGARLTIDVLEVYDGLSCISSEFRLATAASISEATAPSLCIDEAFHASS